MNLGGSSYCFSSADAETVHQTEITAAAAILSGSSYLFTSYAVAAHQASICARQNKTVGFKGTATFPFLYLSNKSLIVT
jgi:hypothetical protein